MFQDVRGPRTGAKTCRIDAQTLQLEIFVRVRGEKIPEKIDLKPYFQAYLQQQKAGQTA